LDNIIDHVYQELRHLANIQLQNHNNSNNSIQCHDLVAEAYLRLVKVENMNWTDRNHFFSLAAKIMRRVLVDEYRKGITQKRGQFKTLVTYNDVATAEKQDSLVLDKIDDAIQTLEKLDPRQAEIVTMRFFGGLLVEEIADILSVSTRTIRREWAVARLWLHKELENS
jgi:RNA polymerase sigma factor (TIGR02999 family)